jgi:hypothetical protein
VSRSLLQGHTGAPVGREAEGGALWAKALMWFWEKEQEGSREAMLRTDQLEQS